MTFWIPAAAACENRKDIYLQTFFFPSAILKDDVASLYANDAISECSKWKIVYKENEKIFREKSNYPIHGMTPIALRETFI